MNGSRQNDHRTLLFRGLPDGLDALILDNGSTAAARQPRSNMP
ncbi:hypothetical protein [Pseudomonas sp. C11]|nr:hypothetical protein [Pseudomonas sp. C11]